MNRPGIELALLLNLIAFGCAASEYECVTTVPLASGIDQTAYRPGQLEAERIVWQDIFGQTGPAPVVLWKAENCGPEMHTGVAGNCTYGEADSANNWAAVTWPAGYSISQTTYAHELAHVANFRDNGDGDGAHAGPYFLGGRATAANAALKEVGL